MPVTWTKWTSYKCGYATGNTSVDDCDAKWLAFGKTGQVSGTDAHNSFVSNGEGGQRLWDGTNSYTGSRSYPCSATTAFWNQRKAS
jgi:hypothetical protein